MSIARKDYLCQVTIVEGRELAGADPSGTSDPFVKVTCGNAPPQATTTEDETNNPCWNQSFTFSKLSLTDHELETWELKLECIDFNAFFLNKLIGAYSIGLATLNRNSNHEFYNMWVTLLHPEFGSSPRGYLLINCFILGPDDDPPAHAIGEQMGLDEDAEDSDDDLDELLTPEQRKMKKMKKQAIGVVKVPMIAKKSFQLSVNIYKAERLPKFGGADVSGFVSVRAAGFVEKSHVIDSNRNPIWNIKISFPASTPILNDRIIIRVWDHRARSRDKMVASLPENPIDHDLFNISTLISRGGVLSCRWCNLYGPSEEEDTIWNDIKKLTGLAKKSYMGTCFLGRLLISMSISPNDEPETGINRAAPYREPVAKLHQLRVTLYELKNAGDCGDSVFIEVSMDDFRKRSKTVAKKEKMDPAAKETMVGFYWGSSYSGEVVEEIREPFPIDTSQAPDVFLNLYSIGLMGTKRIGYIRKPVSEIIGNDNPIWIPFKSIDKHSNIGAASPGLLLVSLFFGVDSEAGSRGAKIKPRKVDKWLCWNIYGGLDMAPALEDSGTNIYLKIYCGDNCINMVKEKIPQVAGKFPIWEWVDFRKLQLHEELCFEQNLRVEVHNTSNFLKFIPDNEEIGQFSIPLQACEKKWKQPHFFHVINSKQGGVSQGRIIAEFYVSKEEVKTATNPCVEALEMLECDVEVALLGIRGLKPPYEELKITLEIPGYKTRDGKPATEVVVPVGLTDRSNPNIQQIVRFKGIMLPKKLIYLPAIYVKIEDTSLMSWNKCFTYISLIKYCKWAESEVHKKEAIDNYYSPLTEKLMLEQLPTVNAEARKEVVEKKEEMTDYGSDNAEGSGEDSDESIKPLPMDEIFEPKNSKIGTRIQFDKVEEHEMKERTLREETEVVFDAEYKALRKEADLKLQKKGEVPQDLKDKLRELEKKLEIVRAGPMREEVFLKKEEDLEEDGGFQYNRPVYKQGLLDDIQTPPYERYPLFKKTKNSEKLSVYKMGEPIGAILKATVNIKIVSSDALEDMIPEDMKWDFNFFHPIFGEDSSLIEALKGLEIAVRVYLLRGLSLCAVDNASDLPAFAAGLDALSSASSYPEIQVGESQVR